MNDWFRKYPFNDYKSAIAHLDQRSKRVRDDAPLAHAVRLVRHFVSDSSVSVVYHQTPIVTFWENGTQALHWGGWYTKTTFEHIERYAKLGDLRISAHNRDKHGRGEGVAWHFKRDNWPRTPSRMTSCRRCKGTGRGKQGLRYIDGDLVTSDRCYNCGGHGKVERGLKLIPEIATSGALLITPAQGSFPQTVTVYDWDAPTYDCKCSLCQCGCGTWMEHWQHAKTKKQQYSYAPVSPTPKYSAHHMGSEVADRLTELLPGLRKAARCPRCKEQRSVRELIVHLNDKHRATREEIADWLETLDIDLRFPTPEPAFS
jgi:hypothetical protein